MPLSGPLGDIATRILHSVPELWTAAECKLAILMMKGHRADRDTLTGGVSPLDYDRLIDYYNSVPREAPANSMIAGALHSGLNAKNSWDDQLRMLQVPNPQNSERLSGAMSYYPPGYWKGTPFENSTYVEELGSLEPGLGKALLQNLAQRYPSNPMVLQSLPIDATRQFYAKRGFLPTTNGLPGAEHDTLVLPEARLMKKKGGQVRG